MLQPILEKAQRDAEARMPISKSDLKALLDAVDEGCFKEREGSPVCLCDHTLRCTREFLRSRSLSEDQIIPWLAEHGGHCDCEVVYNVGECWGEKVGCE